MWIGGAVVARGHTCGVLGGRLGVALGLWAGWSCSKLSWPRCPPRARGWRSNCAISVHVPSGVRRARGVLSVWSVPGAGEGFTSKTSFGGAVVARGHTCGVRGGRLGVALGLWAWWSCSKLSWPRFPPRAKGSRGDCGRDGEGMRTASMSPVREGFQSKGRQTSFGGAVVARGHTCGVLGGRLGVALGLWAGWSCSKLSWPRCPRREKGFRVWSIPGARGSLQGSKGISERIADKKGICDE